MRKMLMGFAAAGIGALAGSAALAPEAAMADDAPFATPAEAKAYLIKTLPEAVAANPKYRAKATGVITRWTLKSIAFNVLDDKSIEVATDETYDEIKGGAVRPGTHHARFPIDDVKIEDEVSDWDTTESGGEARGVIFRCKGQPCVHAVWDGKETLDAWTDIYIQDSATRERVIAAFRALKTPGQ